jgi:hypothetical protein
MKEGMNRADALRAVRLERGTLEVTKEVVRSAGWESLVETCWQDLRFEWQRQEIEDREDYIMVRPRRYRAQARSRRTRAQRARSWAGAGVQRSCVLMCSTRRPSDDFGGPFLFLVLTISPPLRFGPTLYPVAEEALGRQVSEHQRDGSATIQAPIHHRQALLAPHRSVEFLGACAASCSCLQEEPPSSNPLAYKKSISHMPYGADIDRRSHKCSSRGLYAARGITVIMPTPQLCRQLPSRVPNGVYFFDLARRSSKQRAQRVTSRTVL